jgi:hypothetical protein
MVNLRFNFVDTLGAPVERFIENLRLLNDIVPDRASFKLPLITEDILGLYKHCPENCASLCTMP